MARVTIDSSLFTDPRFNKALVVLGAKETIGQWVMLLFAAEKYYLSHGYIPTEILRHASIDSCFRDFELIIETDGGYKLFNQDEQFSWLRKQAENGRKGGLARASNAKRALSASSDSSQIKPTITTSITITKEKENIIKEKEPKPTPIGHSSENKFSSEFEEIKNLYPKRKGHLNLAGARKAVVKLLGSGVSLDELKSAARAYKEDCSKSGRTGTEFVLQMSTFFGKNEIWREYLNVKKKSGFTAEELGITSTYQP